MLEWQLLKTLEITSVGKDVEKRQPLCTVGGNVTGAAAVETVWTAVWNARCPHLQFPVVNQQPLDRQGH